MTSKLAAQLFTVRDFIKTERGLAESLEKLAAIGYPAVQLSAVEAMDGEQPEVDAGKARKLLDNNGLKCIATHRGWDKLATATEAELEFHHILGCDYTAIGGLPAENRENLDAVRAWGAEALPVIQRLKQGGLRFGYHNHAFEFERFGPERKTIYDVLIDEGGKDLLLEIDVYWVDHAGVNPVRIIERTHGRLPVIHIKDKEMAGQEPVMAPIGEGNLDWPEIIPALEAAGVEWYAVEQDTCRRDPFDCLKSSFDFLTAQGL